jgi:Gpi18-like mannosyltransferase
MTVRKQQLYKWMQNRKWTWSIMGFVTLLITPFFWLTVMIIENHDDFLDMVNECIDVMLMRVNDD